MSNFIISLVWAERNKFFSSTEKLILVRLADYADSEGKCFPSILTLCEETSLAKRGVINTLKSLANKNIIYKSRKHRNNSYVINVEYLKSLSPNKQKNSVHKSVDNIVNSLLITCEYENPQVHHVHFTGAPRALEIGAPRAPVIDPSFIDPPFDPSTNDYEIKTKDEILEKEIIIQLNELNPSYPQVNKILLKKHGAQKINQCIREMESYALKNNTEIRSKGAFLRTMLGRPKKQIVVAIETISLSQIDSPILSDKKPLYESLNDF